MRSNNNAPFDFEVAGPAQELNATIDFSSRDADLLYGDDGETVIGYRYLLAIIIHFDKEPFAEQVQFSQPLNLNGTTLRLQVPLSPFRPTQSTNASLLIPSR
jgi:hypothetical protein